MATSGQSCFHGCSVDGLVFRARDTREPLTCPYRGYVATRCPVLAGTFFYVPTVLTYLSTAHNGAVVPARNANHVGLEIRSTASFFFIQIWERPWHSSTLLVMAIMLVSEFNSHAINLSRFVA